MRRSIVAAAIVAALALTGCSSDEDLGKEVSIAGLSINVPEEWIVENDDDYSSGFGVTYISSQDKKDSMTVMYDDFGSFDPGREMESNKDIYGDALSYDLVSQTEIDGHSCSRYTASMTGSDGSSYPAAFIFVDGDDFDYSISYYGDSLDVDKLIDSIYLS